VSTSYIYLYLYVYRKESICCWNDTIALVYLTIFVPPRSDYYFSSPENSMFELSRWAARVLQEFQNDKLKPKYTYEEFKQEVRKIPRGTDFSRIAKDTMETRLAKKRDEANQRMHVDLLDDDDDDDESDDNVLKPIALDRTKLNTKRPKSEAIDYSEWAQSALQKKCVESGLPKTGAKAALIQRLNGPFPPAAWVKRKQKGEYIPARHDTGATALLVGLWLEQRKILIPSDFKGMAKEELYILAESLNISKNPFSGGTTQTGPCHYDGWSNMKGLLNGGDPPLAIRLKGGRYKLSCNCETAGFQLAEAMHQWCHAYNKCSCEEVGYEYHEYHE
jgi:hypothetical protein